MSGATSRRLPNLAEMPGPSKRRYKGGGEDTPSRRANKENPKRRKASPPSMRMTPRNVDTELLKKEVRQLGDKLAQVTSKADERKVKLDLALREVEGLKEDKARWDKERLRLERDVQQLKRDKKTLEKREIERAKIESKKSAASNHEGFFQDVLENIKEMAESSFSCSICSDLFISPKVIDCGHSFCEECLEDWKKASLVRGPPNCPICRTNIGREIRNIVLDDYIDKTVENFFPEIARKSRLDTAKERKQLKKRRVARQRRAQSGASQMGAQSLNFQGLNIRVLLGANNRTINLIDEDTSSDEDDWNPPNLPPGPLRSRSTSGSSSGSDSSSSARPLASNEEVRVGPAEANVRREEDEDDSDDTSDTEDTDEDSYNSD